MSRLKRRLLRLGAFVVVLGSISTCNMLNERDNDRSLGRRKLADLEVGLDRTDPGWRLADIVTRRNAVIPPDDRNLTQLCWEVHDKRPQRVESWTASRGDWLPTPALNLLPAVRDLATADEVFVEAREAVELARTVRTRPTGGWRLVPETNPLDTRLEHVQRVRTVAVLLQLDAVLAVHAGEWSRAVDATAGILHLSAAVGDEPFLISQLVRNATDAIGVQTAERLVNWGEPPATTLTGVEAALLSAAEVPRLEIGFRGERAMLHQMFANLDAGRFTLRHLCGGQPELLDGFNEWVYRGKLLNDQAYSLEHQTRLLEIARLPTHEQVDRFAEIDLPPTEFDYLLSRTLLPDFTKLAAAEWRIRARLRSAAVGLACERFRQANNRWPNDLAELKELLPVIPLDPYDGQSLRYRKLADGVVVYAVGPDRQDDSGNLSYGNPQPGEDVGFRLWDVAARRQPAEE